MNYYITVIVPVIAVIIIGIVIERILSRLISRSGQKKKMRIPDVHLIKLIVRWFLFIIVLVIVAGIFGISVTNLWITVTGIVAMALIGFFAVWSILSNTLATLVVLLWRPFKIGNKITILPEEISGEVVELNLFFTKLKTEEGDTISIPNVTFVTKFIRVSSRK